MTTLFPPVIESRAVAIPFAEPSDIDSRTYNIEFFVPEVDGPIATVPGAIGINHIQVVLRYKSTGDYAVNSNYSPDRATLFIPTYVGNYVEYNGATGYCKLKIPYKFFRNTHPEKAVTYTAQIRFGANMLWMHSVGPTYDDPYTGTKADFLGFGDWQRNQVSTVPSNFGEWSNTQSVYCYGDAKVSLTYNLNDFVPELLYEYAPEDNDPLEQCKIVYNYADINGSIMKSLVFNGVAQSDGSYTLRAKLPIAPLQVIYISLEAVTVNGTVRGKTLNIPPIVEGAGGLLPEVANPAIMEDLVLKGEELEDGVIAKKLIIPFTAWTNSQTLSIYRTNTFSFETIRLKDNIPLVGVTEFRFKDFSVEMGEDYQYIAILKENGIATRQLARIYPWGFSNPGYGRQMLLNSTFLDDKNHQLRIQGNVSVSNFKRNTADQFQTTIGSKYPFYSRSAKTDYRTLQLSGVVTINLDPTASFLHNDQVDGLRWEDDEESRLLILNRDIYSDSEYSMSRVRVGEDSMTKQEIIEYGTNDESMVRGPASIFDSYYARNQQSRIEPTRSDVMVFMERKFRESVMKWLADGKPKLFRSETEGNMIVMPSAVSFTPLDKTGRIVYTVSMTLTEIAELNLENLVNYDLMPMEIETHTLRNFPVELHIGDIISQADYLALLFYGYEYEDNFVRVGSDYQVVDETGLQEILDTISEFSFLRGTPQYPIFDKLTFVKDDDFNLGFILIPDAGDYGWEGPVYKTGEKAGQLHPFLDGVVYANGLDGHVVKFSNVTPLPSGMRLDENTGRLFIEAGDYPDEKPPQKLTFKVSDESNSEVYFTISMGSLYVPLEMGDDVITARSTRDDIDLELIAFGGVKFSDVSGNPNDLAYLFSAENLPYGLNITPDGHIKGRIVGKQESGEITVRAKDAIGQSASATISFSDIFYWPYINQSPYFDVGYIEVGEEITPINIKDYVVGGSGNFTFSVVGTEATELLPAGLSLDATTGIISGFPTAVSDPDPEEEKKLKAARTVTIGLTDSDLSGAGPHATCEINFGRLLDAFTFVDNSTDGVLTEIKGPGDMNGTIPIGYVIKEINLMNYVETTGGDPIQFVSGGLPFYDANGNPYYKFSATNLYPDFKLTTAGILSGRAMVGSDERFAYLSAMDARGKIIPLTKNDGSGDTQTTKIHEITSALMTTEVFTSDVEATLALPNVKEGLDGITTYKVDIPIKIMKDGELVDVVTGGYIGNGSGYEGYLAEAEDLPDWMELTREASDVGGGEIAFTLSQKAGVPREISKPRIIKIKIFDQTKSDDGSDNPQAIYVNVKVGEVVEEMRIDTSKAFAFAPPLSVGVKSVAQIPPITGGIAPYTISAKGTSLDKTPFKMYQGQGAEQDPNYFYIAGTPVNTDPVPSETFIITDGIGQQIEVVLGSSTPAGQLDFTTMNDMRSFNLVAGLSSIPVRQIIQGEAGIPSAPGVYQYGYRGVEGTTVELFPGVTFNGANGSIYGTPTTPDVKGKSISREFTVVDTVTSRSYNDGMKKHIWKTPLVYEAPVANGSLTVPKKNEQDYYESDQLFGGGVGSGAQHPEVWYQYSTNGVDFIDLADGQELVSGGNNTGLVWKEGSVRLIAESLSYFEDTTFTIRANITANADTNMLVSDYSVENTIHFEGVVKGLAWQTYETPPRRLPNINYVIPMQHAPSVKDYVYTLNISDIVDVAKVDGGVTPLMYNFVGDVPTGWSLSGSTLTYTYSNEDGKPDKTKSTVQVTITDSTIGSPKQISINVGWKGVMEDLHVTLGPGWATLANDYALQPGLTRDLTSPDFDITVTGGNGGEPDSYLFEMLNSKPYEKAFFDNHYRLPKENRTANFDGYCYPARTVTLYCWDNIVDPERDAQVAITVNIGAITGGLPQYPKTEGTEISIPSVAKDTTATLNIPKGTYFYGTTNFEVAVKAVPATWAAAGGDITIDGASGGTDFNLKYTAPNTAVAATEVVLVITSKETATNNMTMEIKVPVGAVTN